VPGIPNGAEITLTQLAAMESGVKNYTAVIAFLEKFAKDLARPWTNVEIVSYAVPESPVFGPGENYNYSNTNTVLLGMVIEAIAQVPLGSVMQTRIFDALAWRTRRIHSSSNCPILTRRPIPSA
jgi:D-alanyl-D-alanine carboxypeptidase